jgi:hypothetical protein
LHLTKTKWGWAKVVETPDRGVLVDPGREFLIKLDELKSEISNYSPELAFCIFYGIRDEIINALNELDNGFIPYFQSLRDNIISSCKKMLDLFSCLKNNQNHQYWNTQYKELCGQFDNGNFKYRIEKVGDQIKPIKFSNLGRIRFEQILDWIERNIGMKLDLGASFIKYLNYEPLHPTFLLLVGIYKIREDVFYKYRNNIVGERHLYEVGSVLFRGSLAFILAQKYYKTNN